MLARLLLEDEGVTDGETRGESVQGQGGLRKFYIYALVVSWFNALSLPRIKGLVLSILTWFRAESFTSWRVVPRCHRPFTLHFLFLGFALVLLIGGIILCCRLAAWMFCWRDVQLHVQRNRTNHRTLCLRGGGGGGGGWRWKLGIRKDSGGGRHVLLLASSFPGHLLLLLKLLLLEAALLLTKLCSAVFEPNLEDKDYYRPLIGNWGRDFSALR